MKRSGFTFIEILFAVMILGIGFIFLSAMFPVAIVTQQATVNESYGNAQVRSLAQTIHAVAENTPAPSPAFPFLAATGTPSVFAMPTADQWNIIYQDCRNATDPRFASSYIYRRDATSQDATVIIASIKSQVLESYPVASTQRLTTFPADIEFKPVRVTMVHDSLGGTVTITDNGVAGMSDAATQSAAFVVADDVTGKVYRLSELTAGTWTLSPDGAMAGPSEDRTNVAAFLIGRGYRTPNNPAAGFEGGNQVVSIEKFTITMPAGF